MADFLKKKHHHRKEEEFALLKLDLSIWSIVFYALWILHLVFSIVGWNELWSTTFYEIVSDPPLPVDGLSDPLYKATFWTNVKEFWENNAEAISVLTVIAGFVQPLLKAIAMVGIAFYPLTRKMRERAITLQETTSKFSLTPFYVEALLLIAFSYEMTILPLNMMVKIWIKINSGMMYYFVAQVCAMLMINVLRVVHRRAEDDRGSGASRVRPSASNTLNLESEHNSLHQDYDNIVSIKRNMLNGVHTENKYSHTHPTTATKNSYSKFVGGQEDEDWIEQDSRDKQFKRDLRRAIVVVPAALLANGLFFYLYFYPFIEFEASGILSRFITENGPVSQISFKGLADGLFKYAHPWEFAIIFAISLYVMMFAIPFCLCFCAAIDALLPLLPHWANRNRGQRNSLVGRMRSSSVIVQTLSDDEWVVDARFALREAVELISPWGTAEAAVVAAFFTVPNATNVAHWMFDDKQPCPQIEQATGSLETCITVKAHLLAGPGVALVAWIVLVVILGRVVLDGQRGLSYLVVEDDEDSEDESRLYINGVPNSSSRSEEGSSPIIASE